MIQLYFHSAIPTSPKIFLTNRDNFSKYVRILLEQKREVHLACTGPPCRGWLPTGAVSWGRQVHLDTANLPTVCARAEQAQRASNPQTGPTLKQPTPVSYPAFPTHLANFLQFLDVRWERATFCTVTFLGGAGRRTHVDRFLRRLSTPMAPSAINLPNILFQTTTIKASCARNSPSPRGSCFIIKAYLGTDVVDNINLRKSLSRRLLLRQESSL